MSSVGQRVLVACGMIAYDMSSVGELVSVLQLFVRYLTSMS
jgi:hypothetical protein